MDAILSVIDWIKDNIKTLLEIVGSFALIATLTPNKTDDKFMQAVLDFINLLGGNLGKAKNA